MSSPSGVIFDHLLQFLPIVGHHLPGFGIVAVHEDEQVCTEDGKEEVSSLVLFIELVKLLLELFEHQKSFFLGVSDYLGRRLTCWDKVALESDEDMTQISVCVN
jgi:hypothetical protein